MTANGRRRRSRAANNVAPRAGGGRALPADRADVHRCSTSRCRPRSREAAVLAAAAAAKVAGRGRAAAAQARGAAQPQGASQGQGAAAAPSSAPSGANAPAACGAGTRGRPRRAATQQATQPSSSGRPDSPEARGGGDAHGGRWTWRRGWPRVRRRRAAGSRFGGGRGGFDPNMTPEERRKRMEERMATMTPEERERMPGAHEGARGPGRRTRRLRRWTGRRSAWCRRRTWERCRRTWGRTKRGWHHRQRWPARAGSRTAG